ncbi:hypothetical protein ACFQE7_37050 [Nonomuraea ferruginea]|uniref:hypothetical protein n=1 Tax=Nonomuraea ferruginea TaxID=46174 RepID=UPI00360C4357
MRRTLGALAVVAGLTACAPSTSGAAPEAAEPAGGAAPAKTEEATPEPAPESDECRVSVVKPGVSALGIRASAVRRGCEHPALLRVRVMRAVPGDDPVIKSGATRKGRITLKLPCEPGTYYTVATDYRGGTAKSKATRVTCATPRPPPRPPPPRPLRPLPLPPGRRRLPRRRRPSSPSARCWRTRSSG